MTKKLKALWVDEDTYQKVKKQAEKDYYKISMLVKVMINGYIVAKDNNKR